jgi:hypothetical protein
VTAVLEGVATYSWAGNWYVKTGQGTSQILIPLGADPASVWATPNGNPSNASRADGLCECIVQTSAGGPLNPTAITGAAQLNNGMEATNFASPASIANCPICSLPAPSSLPSCLTISGSGPTYLLLIGDPGKDIHNVGQNFNITAQTAANAFQLQGNKVVACRVSSVENVVSALTSNGFIGGGVAYFGHGGPYNLLDSAGHVTGQVSLLEPGQAQGVY